MLNAFFLLDEKRLNMPLYRHPFDDILYDVAAAADAL